MHIPQKFLQSPPPQFDNVLTKYCFLYSTVKIIYCTVTRNSLEKIFHMNVTFDFIKQ